MKAAEILQTAAGIVGGARANTHGPANVNLENIATLWRAYLQLRPASSELDAVDVAHMMALLKVARTKTGQCNTDDWVDACGYLALAAEMRILHNSEHGE